MTYTVRVFSHDAAVHHDNNLLADTVDDFKQALALARKRTKETNYNTGSAVVVDNDILGNMGDNGVVASFRTTRAGVRRDYIREEYRILLRRSKITGEGLLALYNPELALWEYFQTTGQSGAALTLVGSTEQFQQ